MGRALVLLCLLPLLACSTKKNLGHFGKSTPPGTIQIAENRFVDQAEINNLDWLEYLFWIDRMFGAGSEEYRAAFPDTTVWDMPDAECIGPLYSDGYLRHPAFRSYPVVGVSQQQALDYLKWRSDRVFEYLLIRNEIIPWKADQNGDSYFSIEKYFNGDYEGMEPDGRIDAYPHYYLPSQEEFRYLLSYNDSISNTRRRHRMTQKTAQEYDALQIDVQVCAGDTLIAEPIRATDIDLVADKEKQLYNLVGNVAEWLSEGGMYAGKSWNDSLDAPLVGHGDRPRAYIGFRALCTWVKVEAPR